MANTKPATKILRILILDDSPDDTEQASSALRQAGYMLKTQRLETGVAVEQNLESGQWDLLLCAHGIASLPARQVVELVRHKKLLTPVIVLARRIQDDELRSLMQAGARDVVIKGQWGRLVPVVERELALVEERREWQTSMDALHQLEARYRTMIEASVEAISYVQDGMHMDANTAYLKLLGYDDIESLKEMPLLNLIDKADQARFKQALKKPEGADKTQEFNMVTTAGQRVAVEVALTPITISGHPSVQVVATDISKRKALETKLQSMHQRDALTGLFNRPHFLNLLGDALKQPGGLLFGVTLNGLAEINQQIGHVACDRLLVQLGLQLREAAGAQASLARIAGGQFAVLLDSKAASQGSQVEEKIGKLINALSAGEGNQSIKPDVSLLSCKLDGKQKDRQKILESVFATEAAASVPRPVAVPRPVPAPPVSVPTPTPAPAARITETPPVLRPVPATAASSNLREALQQALAQNRMELTFQPIVNLHGEPRCFYEARLMLRTPDDQLIPPAQYMPVADAAGLSGKVDRAVLMNVIDTLSKYHLEGRPGIVFLSLSGNVVQDNALLTAIQMHMKATGLAPENVILQIDEETVAKHLEASRAFVLMAKTVGVGVALDHFSARRLSIEQLAGVEFDYIAVDCGPGGLADEDLYTAIDAVLALDRLIIARNIDDADLFTTLFSRGVHYIQGDYLQPASSGLDYSFEAEQTLSDVPAGPTWSARA